MFDLIYFLYTLGKYKIKVTKRVKWYTVLVPVCT